MAPKIRVLSDLTINQIAAGEVIENPASLVKELVENALDARAKEIRIEIQGGGHFLIRVSDDGVGMAQDDAFLAFERHATSKIREFDDLSKLSSMGFRGEALASIASVSKVILESAEEGQMGTRVECVFGKILSHTGIARKKGTTIEVRSLFCNVPARKKFQKGQGPSTQEIVKMVVRLSLAHPEISFALTSQDKTLFRSEPSKEKRAQEVLGTLCEPVEIVEKGYRLSAFFAPPHMARSNRLGQYFLVNQRPITSPFLSRIVKEAYGARIGSDQHPSFVLWLEVPPHLIDVNVHPQKSEVRFKEEEFLYSFLQKGVTEALRSKEKISFAPLPFMQKGDFTRKMDTTVEELPLVVTPKVHVQEKELPFSTLTFLTFLGKVALYRTAQNQILLLDLAALHAKKVFEEVKKRLETKDDPPLQNLLFPKTLTFSKDEMLLLEENEETLLRMGVKASRFGKSSILVDAIAETVSLDEVETILTSFLESAKGDVDLEKCARIAALHTRNKNYTREEAHLLIEEMLQEKTIPLSPKGKKIFCLIEEKTLIEMLL